ncbi:class I SAM-dependent methyltransferase [Thermodesulfobacteriota bacterium]
MTHSQLFDSWPDRYDGWFETPLGKLIRHVESEIVIDLLQPGRGETILDAGCGTAIFTVDILATGARVVGLDISYPMLRQTESKVGCYPFDPIQGDILSLPFSDGTFDRTVSVTALEFIANARRAVDELFRVTRPGGIVVVATLNSKSSWATERKQEAQENRVSLFSRAIFRSPAELAALGHAPAYVTTAIHFHRGAALEQARNAELEGRRKGLDTGAFVACSWTKPRPLGAIHA